MAGDFWRSVIDRADPKPTIANPMFVTERLVEQFPIPDWLKSHRDFMRNGYYVGLDTPEARRIQVERLRATLAPYMDDD